MSQKWMRVGKAKDAQGLRGELYILLFAKEAPWIKDLKQFALATDDTGPFEVLEVEKARTRTGGIVVKTPKLNDRTQAEAKRGLLFYIPTDLMNSKKGEDIFLREILGFEVRTEKEIVGRIESMSSNGAQDLLVVRRREKQLVEIPFVEAFVKSLDYENKVLHMDLPEGLWEDEE